MKIFIFIESAILTALSVATIGQSQPASSPAAIELGPRYISIPNGVSIRPPADADKEQEEPLLHQVTWTRRDANTGAIAWTLLAIKVKDSNAGSELKNLANLLGDSLTKSGEFKTVSCEAAKLAGRDVVDIRAITQGKAQFWQRQIWIPAGESEFLIISISGPISDKKRLSAIFQASAETVELLNRDELLARREANLAEGKKLLTSLTDEKLSSVVAKAPQWLRIDYKNETVGFVFIREGMEIRDGSSGLATATLTVMKRSDGKFRHQTVSGFATADRKREDWSESNPSAESAAVSSADLVGTKRGNAIECTILSDGKAPSRRKLTLAESMDQAYLPRAHGCMLGRLVDRHREASYAFACYNSAANAMDVRTFRIIGQEKIL